MNETSGMREKTRATGAGRAPHSNHGVVNPPVYHASTILYPSYQALRDSRHIPAGDGITYGVHGTPTTFALEDAIRAIEGGDRTRLQPSGLVACTLPLLAYLSAGDHLLMTDSVYGPTRAFCDGMLRRMGVETTYYDPLIGAGIAALMRPETKVVFVEAPGSWTFEMQDVPAIAEVAQARGAVVMMDNTWASPLYFKPFDHGVNVSIQAVTKYIAGHSDLVMGSVTCDAAHYPVFREAQRETGVCVSPDDVFLAMRGIRTLPTRMPVHWTNGLKAAEWLRARPEVAAVLHPALESDPGHKIWRRDFAGASGLFGFVLKPAYSSEAHLAAMLDHMRLFGMGFSWGGFESLLIPTYPKAIRTATPWPRADRPDIPADGQPMRIHIGLEDLDDLLDDLRDGFARMAAV